MIEWIALFVTLKTKLKMWGRGPKSILGLGPCPKRHNGSRIDQH